MSKNNEFEKTETIKLPQEIQQHLAMSNLRLNDYIIQANATIKALLEAYVALKKENADLKSKQQTSQQ